MLCTSVIKLRSMQSIHSYKDDQRLMCILNPVASLLEVVRARVRILSNEIYRHYFTKSDDDC